MAYVITFCDKLLVILMGFIYELCIFILFDELKIFSVGGDVTPKNVWLAESLLDIFIENRYHSCYYCFLIGL